MLAARYMAGRVGDELDGDILRIKHFGLVVQLVGRSRAPGNDRWRGGVLERGSGG